MKKGLVITVDGPAGAGKSTVSKKLAQQLSYIYLDTGALYRAVAYQLFVEAVSPDNAKALSDLLRRINISLKNMEGKLNVFINGENITEKIRNEEIGLLASKVSAIPIVRQSLLSIQRDAGAKRGNCCRGKRYGDSRFSCRRL